MLSSSAGASFKTPEQFIARWQNASGSELANAQSFVRELSELLDVPPPNPAREDTRDNDYVFERRVIFKHGDGKTSEGRIDCYKRSHFVLEAKKLKLGAQTKGFDDALLRARSQAENYARALPADEGRPPFLLVVDVGHVIELYAELTRSGATYTPFPDPRSHRIRLTDLAHEKTRERLKAIWTDPLSLDPTRASAKATREIADRLAGVAKALEAAGHGAERIAGFLTRCLFCLFAEDVGLLPRRDGKGAFTGLLDTLSQAPEQFVPMVGALWREMDSGGFSVILRDTLPRFNGKLFKQPDVLPLTRDQIDLLREAGKADWTQVEPAIFGTLLERALNPAERHALGAHYTPRAYVERLVLPTVIEPLRAEWANVQAAALLHANAGKPDAALDELDAFHHRLCQIRVLDPACGSANFLYVTLEHLKRLEGEVLDFAHSVGGGQQRLEAEGLTVDPHQFLGLEINPRAAAIAELVLWIGYLQWHFRTRGSGLPPQPILKDFRNIENRDAVLAYDGIELVRDEHGKPITRWDGKTTKPHPVTGEPVPDESARIEVESYINPRPSEWPEADYIVGNPPFIGNKRMRDALGDGYVEALRSSWSAMPDTADLVMYWWHHAAALVRAGSVRRFGFITTNSLSQTFNRRVLEALLGAGHGEAGHAVALMPASGQKSGAGVPRLPAESAPERDGKPKDQGLHLAFAIPDHPWVDSANGAAVRVAMTVGAAGQGTGRLLTARDEREGGEEDAIEVLFAEKTGLVHPDLTVGANVSASKPLQANTGLCFQGMNLVGKGFRLSPEEVAGLGYSLAALPPEIKPHGNARDMMQGGEPCYVIDLFGYTAEEARFRHPALYQWLFDRVKPERDHNNRESRRRNWWIFGEPVGKLRKAWQGLDRIVLTPETSKHRVFQFQALPYCPDHKLYAICSDDAQILGVLSSSAHAIWALSAGGRLGVGNDPTWTNTTCFLTFPFPSATAEQQTRIRDLAEQLDAHRKRQQAHHETLTLTGMYNVLAKLRSGETLNAKEKAIHEMGLVSVLKTLHDELDLAVLDAYGWNDLAPLLHTEAFTEPVLERLVALNAERTREEAGGLIRWLRPEYQNPAVHNFQKNRPDAAPPPPDAPQAVALGEGGGGGRFLAEGRHEAPAAPLAEPPKRKHPATKTADEGSEEADANPPTENRGLSPIKLAKLRSGEALNAKEKAIHEMGLVSVLKTLHDELDLAVLDAYGWNDLTPLLHTEAFTEPVLERLVALNAERTREEAGGLIRWLRPEYQNPTVHPQGIPVGHPAGILFGHNLQKNAGTAAPAQADAPQAVALGEGCGGGRFLAEGRHEAPAAPLAEPPKRKKPATEPADEESDETTANAPAEHRGLSPVNPVKKNWPSTLPEQIAAVAQALAEAGVPLTEPDLAARFTGKGPWKKRLPEILQTLVALGRAQYNGSDWNSR